MISLPMGEENSTEIPFNNVIARAVGSGVRFRADGTFHSCVNGGYIYYEVYYYVNGVKTYWTIRHDPVYIGTNNIRNYTKYTNNSYYCIAGARIRYAPPTTYGDCVDAVNQFVLKTTGAMQVSFDGGTVFYNLCVF